ISALTALRPLRWPTVPETSIGRIGFEPTISRQKLLRIAESVNRLHQRPTISMRLAGFEPATSRLSTVRCCRLSYRRKTDWEGRDRTYNLRFQGPLRYQIALLPSKNPLIQPRFKSMMVLCQDIPKQSLSMLLPHL